MSADWAPAGAVATSCPRAASFPRRRESNLLLFLALLLFSASAAAYSLPVPDFKRLESDLQLRPAQKVQFDIAVAASQRALMSVALAGLEAKERIAEQLSSPRPDLDVIFRAQKDIVEGSLPLFREAGIEWDRLYKMLDRAQVTAARRFIDDQLGPFLSGWR